MVKECWGMIREYEYWVSFETNGTRQMAKGNGYTIHEIITKIRHKFADAHAFIVRNKRCVIREVGNET